MQSDNELLVSEMQKKKQKKNKKMGITYFVSEIKRVKNYPDFQKLAHVVQHALQGFIVKNIESESTEANDLRGHRTSKIFKSRKSYSNGHPPYHGSFYYLARALMHDVTCEFACPVRMRRNN